jgi:hypothetical protein
VLKCKVYMWSQLQQTCSLLQLCWWYPSCIWHRLPLCIIGRPQDPGLPWMRPWWKQVSESYWLNHLQNLIVLVSKLVKC